jgi:NitT/TauT family transport system substrate-binding protein
MAWWSSLANPSPQGGRGLQTHSLHNDSKSPPPLRVKVREGGAYRFLISFIVALLISSFAHAADKVRLSYVLSSVEYADDFLAIDKGYFKEEGIDIDLQQAGGGAAVPALISGDIDFTGSGSVAISAILKGAKLKVLLVVDAHPAMQIWAQPAVKSFADLKGKPIGIISRGDTTEIAIRYYLAKHKLPEDYVSYTPLGAGVTRFAAIASGSFPAALVNASEVEQMRATGKLGDLHRIVDLRQEITMAYNALATSDALIAKNPDLVRRAMRAVIKGMTVTKQNRDVAIAAAMKHGVKDRGAAEADYDGAVDDLSLTGTMPLKAQQIELKVRGQMLSLPQDKILPPNQVFDFSFAQKAAAELKAENWKPKK